MTGKPGVLHTLSSITRSLREKWAHARLLQKLIIGCVAFLIIPVLATGIILFSIVLPLAQNESREAMMLVVSQFNENVRFRVDGYQNILAQLTLDPRLGAVMTQDYASLADAVSSLQQVTMLLSRINSYFPMRRIYVYKSNPTIPEDGGNILDITRAYAEPWYKAWQASAAQRYYWFYALSDFKQPCLNVCASLRDNWSEEQYGVIRLEIPCSQAFDRLANPLTDKGGWIVLLDQERRVLSPANGEWPPGVSAGAPCIDGAYGSAAGSTSTTINGAQCLVVHATTERGWKVVAALSQEVLWRKVGMIQNAAVIVSVLFVVLTVLLLTTFGFNMTRRLTSLVSSMREVRNGNLGLQVTVHGTDEIAATESEFNAMSLRLQSTVHELASARARAEEEELRLLQAQINPHFLYNTLSFVKFMAMDIGASEISGVVDTMARFFRLSLNRGRKTLTVREELEHVRAYMDIHEMRYPRKVTMRCEVDPAAMEAEIITMTLQPIVENALVHAFTRRAGCGTLALTAARNDGELVLRVADDGCGMTAEECRGALAPSDGGHARRGFGLSNVHERLRRHFGASFGLSIRSTPDAGTTVEVHAPYRVHVEEP